MSLNKVLLGGRNERGSRFLGLVTVAVFYLVLLMWSANGQYEAVPLLFALLAALAYQKRNIGLSIVLLATSFFLKYQALLLLPLLAILLPEAVGACGNHSLARCRDALRKLVWPPVSLMIGILALDAFTVFLSLPFMPSAPDLTGSPISFWHIVARDQYALRLATLWLFTLGVAAYLLLKRKHLLAGSLLFMAIALGVQNIVQDWYVVWLFVPPLFSLREIRDALAFWALGFLYLIGRIPDYAYVPNLVRPHVSHIFLASWLDR